MEPKITVKEIQQNYANTFGCHGIWDRYSESDHKVLYYKLQKIFPTVPEPKNQESTEQERKEIKRNNEKLIKQRNDLFKQLWAQRIYSQGNLKMAIIYVLWTPPIEDNQPIRIAKDSTSYVSHPVFRIWKCSIGEESKSCCKLFIDSSGRIYENWANFLSSNIYPSGILVAPKNGTYSVNESGAVMLECYRTPNLTLLKKTIRMFDKNLAVCGIAGATASLIPVRTVIIGGMIVGAFTTVYSMGRSIDDLVDKGQHGQTISISNRRALLDWLSFLSRAFSLGVTFRSFATLGAKSHASPGKTLQIAKASINGIHAASLICNCINLTNNARETISTIKEDKSLSSLEISQLSQELVLLTHSMHNYRLALQIIKASKTNRVSAQTILREEQNQFSYNVDRAINILGIRSIDIREGGDKFRCLNKIPDFLCLIFISGLPYLTKSEEYYALQKANQIVDKFYVANKMALVNCLKILTKIMKKFNKAVDYMIMMAEIFLDKVEKAVGIRVRPLIPFENVLWDVFEISTKLRSSTPNDMIVLSPLKLTATITEEFLTGNFEAILNALKKLYSEYFNKNPSRRIKCELCNGFYEKCEVAEQ